MHDYKPMYCSQNVNIHLTFVRTVQNKKDCKVDNVNENKGERRNGHIF